jgi:N-acetylglucosamine-6-sulfatase
MLALLFVGVLYTATAVAEATQPNIIWIYSDDHAVKAVSAYGGPLADIAPTPNIDRTAKEGLIFRDSLNRVNHLNRVLPLTPTSAQRELNASS